jgi:hypothetical protein
MLHARLRFALALVTLALGACQKSPDRQAGPAGSVPADARPATVSLVPEGGRSAHFNAVNRHLELGGTLYGYVDVDGDVLKAAGELQRLIVELGRTDPTAGLVARQNLAELATLIGLTDVKALGVSSVPEGDGFFRNRLFLYTGGERRGLLAALGGKPAPFRHVGLAPADAAFFGESEMDLGAAYRTIKDVVTKVAGEPAGSQFEATLRRLGEVAAISLLDLIYGLKGRTALVLRVDPEQTTRLPGRNGLVVPAFSAVVAVEGIGPIVEPALARSRDLRRSESGTARIFEPVRSPGINGVQPAIVVDGSMLYLTTSLAFLGECRSQPSGLAQTPDFKAAMAKLGGEGNGLTYVSPRLFARAKEIERLNPSLPARDRAVLGVVLGQLPQGDRPLIAVRTNVEDGILVRSHLNRSMKQDVVALSIYNPVTVGLVAAMAVPAFQKTRETSQEKAVLNNLRMLAAAADQHYLENGVTSATYDQLVGPTRYIKVLQPVAGENYRALRFQKGQPLRVRLQNGKVVQYPAR